VRTTVTLDPDVESTLRKIMRERGVSLKAALNGPICSGTRGVRPGAGRPFVQRTYDMGLHPTYNWDKALALSGVFAGTS
jgi:hypothetical protein